MTWQGLGAVQPLLAVALTQSITHSIDHSLNRSLTQSITQSIDHSINHPSRTLAWRQQHLLVSHPTPHTVALDERALAN